MFLTQFSQLLILLWKLSSVFIIPLIMIAYVTVMRHYDASFSFADLDQGKNIHKWLVLAIYLAYLLFWNRCNRVVSAYLKKLQY